MNRSILIVICDFLLVSLVAFARFEGEREEAPAPQNLPPRAAGANNDLVGTLKLALEDEKSTRERMSTDLQSTRDSLQAQERAMRAQEQALAEREARIREYQENLKRVEAEARQIEQQRSALAQQFAATQGSLQDAQKRLTVATAESTLSKEKLEQLQAELKNREQESKTLQQKLGQVEQAQQAALQEKQQLNTQLQVSEAEKRLTREQLASMHSEVATVRQEKAKLQETTVKLVENVGTLATKSTELTKEIRDYRPMPANAIFNEFVANRVHTRFEGTRSGIFGREVDKGKETETILVTDGAQTFAVYHLEDTPLSLGTPGTDWMRLSGVLSRQGTAFSIVRLSFSALDPRIVFVPIGEPQAKQLGAKIYRIAPDPYRFDEAVLVGTRDAYYGEARFQVDLSTPNYVKMDRNLFRGLVGKFNPSRGDVVISKTGELLGIMANNEYCLVLDKFSIARNLQFGRDLGAQQTGQVLSQLHDRLLAMPFRLQ